MSVENCCAFQKYLPWLIKPVYALQKCTINWMWQLCLNSSCIVLSFEVCFSYRVCHGFKLKKQGNKHLDKFFDQFWRQCRFFNQLRHQWVVWNWNLTTITKSSLSKAVKRSKAFFWLTKVSTTRSLAFKMNFTIMNKPIWMIKNI